MKKLTPILFLIFGGIIIISCKPSRIPLNQEEIKFKSDLTKKYNCDIALEHDYRAVKENKQNGVFYILLENARQDDFCIKDSLELKSITTEVVKHLLPILSHSAN